GWIKEMFGSN
ncbi:hypothetical protein IC591_15045, partial [Escherichia coli]|nr:hypothetical protein [Escherichia coli]